MNVDVIKKAILEAGDVIKKAIPTEGIVEKEGRANYVTGADLASEKILMDAIKKNFPKHLILSEETESNIPDILAVEHLWVIDPIDGTSNFRYDRNYSGISVGYVENGDIKLGMVYDPFRGEFYKAEKGLGAFNNDRRIEVGKTNDIYKSTIAFGNSYEPAITKDHVELFLKINPTPWLLVRGSAVLEICDVANGRIDLFYNRKLRPWDNAAAFLIAREAGAVVKNFNGEDANFVSQEAIAGNNYMVENFLKIIS